MFDKPFKTYDEQLDLLESRNVIIHDRENAKIHLSNLSYYALINGYKDIYDQKDDRFCDPIPFEEFVLLYQSDWTFNNIVFKYITRIERRLKTKMSYLISEKYGEYANLKSNKVTTENDYLSEIHYQRPKGYRDTLEYIRNTPDRIKNKSVSHYLKYHNHVPCWILMSSVSLGLVISWYRLLKPEIKDPLTKEMLIANHETLSQQKGFMKVSLDVLHQYRNAIAHGNKVFANEISVSLGKQQLLSFSNELLQKGEVTKHQAESSALSVIIAVQALLDHDMRSLFIIEIDSFFEAYKSVHLSNQQTITQALQVPEQLITRIHKEANELRNNI